MYLHIPTEKRMLTIYSKQNFRNFAEIMFPESPTHTEDRDYWTGTYRSWENLEEESYLDFGICLFHLDQSKK